MDCLILRDTERLKSKISTRSGVCCRDSWNGASCGAASGVEARRTLCCSCCRTLCCAAAARRSVLQALTYLRKRLLALLVLCWYNRQGLPVAAVAPHLWEQTSRLESFSSRLESFSLRVPFVTHICNQSVISLLWMSISFCNLSFCAKVHVLGTPSSAHGEVLRLGHLFPTEAVGSRAHIYIYIYIYIIYKSGAYIYIYIHTYMRQLRYVGEK
jgi:hypothetical protein